jgi:hypothetical protein
MRHLTQVIIILFLTILALSNDSQASILDAHNEPIEKQTIRAGLIIFPPFIDQLENNQCYGMAIDDLKKIFPPDKYDLNIYCASPSRIYRDFNKGFVDLTINVKTTSSLASNILYSERPYRSLQIFLYSKNTSEPPPFKIAAIRSYSYNGVRLALENKGNEFIDLSNTKEALAVFLRGGSDAILSYKLPFEHYLQAGDKSGLFGSFDFSYQEEFLGSSPTFFAINKRNKSAEKFKKKIDDYFEKANN